MSDELCLSVDLGTGGPKVGLIDINGDVVDFEVHRVETHFNPDGTAVQDAANWWDLVRDTSARLIARNSVARGRVKAVAITGQYSSTVPVDANGLPVGPCLTWLDTRGGPHSRRAVGGPFQGYDARKVLRFIRRTAGAPSTAGADPVGHMLYLRFEQPELVDQTRWFMEPVDYLTMRFTGVASATHASRLAMWMTDNRHLDRLAYDPELLASVGLNDQRLPPLVPFGTIVGRVTARVADQVGLSGDEVVITGIPDLHAAAIGACATEPYATHLALSTTSWISCPVPAKKTDIAHSIASVPGLDNRSYLVINNQETGAKALEWLRSSLGAGQLGFEELTEMASTSAPGAGGVVFTPWLAGERSPIDDKSARGALHNLSITTSSADLVRAVMEGVAANSAWLFRHVEKFTGHTLGPVRLLGGGAQSSLWCQIYADTLDRDVIQVRDPLVAQLRGVAQLAWSALDQRRLGDLDAREAATFHPRSDVVATYRTRVEALPQRYRQQRAWSRRHRGV